MRGPEDIAHHLELIASDLGEMARLWRAEPQLRVAFDIEETGGRVVCLAVTHDGFEPGSHGPLPRRSDPAVRG